MMATIAVQPRSFHRALLIAVVVVWSLGSPVRGQDAAPVKSVPDDQAWTASRTEADGRMVLETATRTFTRDGAPSITLVGVAHIGTADYYKGVQAILDAHDLVLYESVYPTGAAAPGGSDGASRVASTRASMLWLRDRIDATWRADRAVPTIDRVAQHAGIDDSRAPAWIKAASIDAWGQPLTIIALDDGFSLVSLGADGRIGGSGEDADLRLLQRSRQPKADGDGLQRELARMLGLEFQLDRINYAQPAWVVSDMTFAQLEQAFKRRGVTDGMVQGSLRGGGLSGDAIGTVMTILKFMDAASGGSASEAVKVLMVQVLGSKTAAQGDMLGEEGKVILDDRNEVVWADLQQRLAAAPPQRIAIFYGAAHMADFARRLVESGYTAGEVTWSTTLSADPRRAGIDEATMKSLRDAMERAGRRPAKAQQPTPPESDEPSGPAPAAPTPATAP
ncbi:MAG: hypothetical protein KGR22_00410 [Planctomycetes bacterium]|nr:hypothetical protein [Planctomycetota bacterium]